MSKKNSVSLCLPCNVDKPHSQPKNLTFESFAENLNLKTRKLKILFLNFL